MALDCTINNIIPLIVLSCTHLIILLLSCTHLFILLPMCVCVCVQSLSNSVDMKPKAWSTPPSDPSYDNSGEASHLPFRGSVQGRTQRRAAASHEEGPGRGGFMAMAPVDRKRAHDEPYGEPGTSRTRTASRIPCQSHDGYVSNKHA